MTAAAPLSACLPTWLRDAKRWLLWTSQPSPSGKPRKVPHYVNGAKRGPTDTPEDWSHLATYADACKALEQSERYAGIGFALGPDASGNCWQGIDLDDTASRPNLADLASTLPGYVEFSPSGNGVHAIGCGVSFQPLGSNATGIEAYGSGRFFTVTGWAIAGSDSVAAVCLGALVNDTLAPMHGDALQRKPAAPVAPSVMVTDETISDLHSALVAIPADSYEEWIAIGQALCSLGDRGYTLWAEWSAKSQSHNPSVDLARWHTFSGDRTGYAAVFKRAQCCGWENPRRRLDPAVVFGAAPMPEGAPTSLPTIMTNRWVFDLYNPVADASLPPITYRDDRKLWPDSPGKTVTQIIADPKCHKTNWIMAEHFRLMRKGARVLVLALEGTYGVRRNRLPALAMHYGVPLPDLNGRFQVVDIKEGGMFDLSNGACVDAFSEWLKLQGWTDVIIDTQHRASGSLEENSATDARQLWNAVEKIRTVNKVNVTLAHHKGKDSSKGGRGSSADLASVDQQIELIFDRNAMTVTAKVTARKDGVDGFSVPFKVHQPMPDAVPILLPISDEEFKEVTAARDPIAPEVISTALRELGCISGKKCSSKELATKILTVPNCTPTNEAVTKLANQLTKSVNKSGSKISAYASKSGSMRQSSWLWTLPDIELAAG